MSVMKTIIKLRKKVSIDLINDLKKETERGDGGFGHSGIK